MILNTADRRLLLVFWLVLSGCATSPPVATYYPEAAVDLEILWPEPPEVPRYRYAGQLLGESNFQITGGAENVGMRVARWIVGLGRGFNRRPDLLLRPQSGTVGPDGLIYVTDVGRRAVFVFDMHASSLKVWDKADRGVAFDSPIGIARTGSGELLVADAGLGRIVRLTADGRPAGSFGDGILARPTGVAWSENGIFVADSAEHDIKVFDESGTMTRRIGSRGNTAGKFNGPTHLTIRDGLLYVGDTLNARVQVLTEEGRSIRQIGARGLYVGNFTRPKGVAVDSDGHLYVVESYYDHLVIFDSEGNYLLPVNGEDIGAGAFYLPAGIWSDERDRIFLADMYNSRVLILQYLGD